MGKDEPLRISERYVLDTDGVWRFAKKGDPDCARRVFPDMPLDPGIARAVRVLMEGGVETFESCEGGDGHACHEPTVKFYGTQAAGWKAVSICKDFGLPARRLNRCWDMDEGEPSGPYWELVFRSMTKETRNDG